MAYRKIKDSGRDESMEFVCDSVDDIANLPTNVEQGSICFVITGSKVYMLNGNKEWVVI